VVYIVENWKEMEAYSGDVKNGYYQLLEVDGEVEVRVQVGRLGFIRKFKDLKDPLLTQIMDFCRLKYFNISKSVPEYLFFK
jgi:hypothetical protein